MKKILIENRLAFILSSAVILVPQAAAFLMGEHIYYLPLQCLAIHWICLLVTFADWRKHPQTKEAVRLVFWIMPAICLAGSALLLLVKSGQMDISLAIYFMYIGFGLMFLLIGNYLPKIRQNRTMGIKIKWALEDEENWDATHRLGGKVWMACGLVCMVCALFPFSIFGIALFIIAVLAAVVIPTVYSWRYYRKRLASGQIARSKVSRGGALAVGIFSGAMVVFVVWTLLSGDMEVQFQEERLVIDASGWGDYEINYDEIEEVVYEPDGVSGEGKDWRTNGFGNLKMSMGNFRNERLGDYIRYTFNDCEACVLLRTGGKAVVINGKDEPATEELYYTLKEKCG